MEVYYTVESELFNKTQSLVNTFVTCFMDVVQHQLSLGSPRKLAVGLTGLTPGFPFCNKSQNGVP